MVTSAIDLRRDVRADERSVRAERIAAWFKTHVATTCVLVDAQGRPAAEHLHWSRPDTSQYSIRYLIEGPCLFVWGDLGHAVYRWSERVSFGFVAGCDLQYFEGKCQASPVGRDFNEWDERVAKGDLDHWVQQQREDGRTVHAGRIDEARRASASGQHEWKGWLGANGYDLFGNEWYEFAPSFGEVIAQECEAHLTGIKLAVAQLKAAALASAEASV